jgi:uncharacterized alpha-E superfamily protein
MRARDVAEFVVFEACFPRSLRFCLAGIGEALRMVNGDAPAGPAEAALEQLRALIDAGTADTVLAEGIHEFLGRLIAQVAGLHAALGAEYFEIHPEVERCAIS